MSTRDRQLREALNGARDDEERLTIYSRLLTAHAGKLITRDYIIESKRRRAERLAARAAPKPRPAKPRRRAGVVYL